MLPGDTVSRSPLDKPLHQLTEDDISQVTREDCRRYLKEKGMRRPSWNKSQAIQQVISLKTLLETTSDSDATEARKKLYIPRPEIPHRVPSNSAASVKGTSADTQISVSAEESAPCRRQDPPKPDLSADLSGHLAATDNDSVSPRNTSAAGQMTIFYCGKVNVYDDVPSDKARTIMQLAASPLPLPQEALSDVTTTLCSFPCHLQAAGVKIGPSSPLVIFPSLQTVKVAENYQLPREESYLSHEDSLEGQTSRKASVQRYLEKRKDRFKNKRKIAVAPSASLDIYLNHRMGDQISNEQLNRSDTYSPPQPRPPHMPTHCSLVDNIATNANLPADLNDKDVQEC